MNNIVFIMSNLPWPIIYAAMVILLVALIYKKDLSDFKKLVLQCTQKKYSDNEVIINFGKYITKHPFSLMNSDLRLKMLPSMLAANQDAVKLVNKVKTEDVHKENAGLLLYVLFLLKKTDELLFNELSKKIKKYKYSDNEFIKVKNIINNDAVGNNSVLDFDLQEKNDKYFNGILLFYSSEAAKKGQDLKKYAELKEKTIACINEAAIIKIYEKEQNINE